MCQMEGEASWPQKRELDGVRAKVRLSALLPALGEEGEVDG